MVVFPTKNQQDFLELGESSILSQGLGLSVSVGHLQSPLLAA